MNTYYLCHSTGAEIGEDSPAYWLAVNPDDGTGAEATGDVWDAALPLADAIAAAAAVTGTSPDAWELVPGEEHRPDPLGAFPLAFVTG